MSHEPQSAAKEAPPKEKNSIERLHSLITVEELAHLMRVNRKTIYEMVQHGDIPGVVRLGRVIRFCRDAVVNWMRGNGGPALGEKK